MLNRVFLLLDKGWGQCWQSIVISLSEHKIQTNMSTCRAFAAIAASSVQWVSYISVFPFPPFPKFHCSWTNSNWSRFWDENKISLKILIFSYKQCEELRWNWWGDLGYLWMHFSNESLMEKMVVWKPCCFNGFEAKITIRKLFNIMISSVAAMVTGQLHEHNINKNKLFDPQKQYDQWFQNLVLVIYSFGTYGMPLIDSYKIF